MSSLGTYRDSLLVLGKENCNATVYKDILPIFVATVWGRSIHVRRYDVHRYLVLYIFSYSETFVAIVSIL